MAAKATPWLDNAFSFIASHGVAFQEVYPYRADAGFCRSGKEVLHIQNHVDLPPDEEALKAAVATVGPVAVAVSADSFGFKFYSGGIFSGDTCDSEKLDHAVLVVGYGTENGRDFWILKNSWGSWGENGYMRLARNSRNACGVASMATYPVF